MPPAAGAAAAAALVARLAASPRPAGGAAEAAARAHVADRLRAAGFSVREEPFAYSALSGRWATPIGGALSALALAAAAHAGARGDARAAAAVLAAGGAAVGGWAWWAARRGVLGAPILRRAATNLVAVRGTARPRVWLCAHLDSKRQPVSILVRAAGVTLGLLAWAGAAALVVRSLLGGDASGWWPAVGAAGVLGALPVVCSVVLDGSPGALDNASGVAAVVLAAERAQAGLPIGVLLTSAEELGLAGAQAWARATPAAGETVLNCDGVDDDGPSTLFFSGGRPDAAIAAVLRAAADAGVATRVRRLLPGVLTDSVAFANGGRGAITLSRGTLGTLSRIHTRRDTADRLTGAGVADAAALLAGAAAHLVHGTFDER